MNSTDAKPYQNGVDALVNFKSHASNAPNACAVPVSLFTQVFTPTYTMSHHSLYEGNVQPTQNQLTFSAIREKQHVNEVFADTTITKLRLSIFLNVNN